MRIASEIDLAPFLAQFAELRPRAAGYRTEMIDHPTAGSSLRNYVILTECADLLGGLGLSAEERFWGRYYWLARFAREWQTAVGTDAGLEQQVYQLLEAAEHIPVGLGPLPEVEAAVERDSDPRPSG